MPTPEEQFTEALKDVNDTLEEVKVVLIQVRDVGSIEPIDTGEIPNRVMVTDGGGNTTTSTITTTELNYLDNLTGNVQNQLNNKLNKKLDVSAANKLLYADSQGNLAPLPNVTVFEVQKLSGITGNIMTLLDQRVPRVTDNKNGVMVTGDGGEVMVHPTVDYGTLGKLAGTTSNVQEQIDSKVSTGGHGAYEVLTTDANGNVIAHPYVDSNELGYLNGLTGYVQQQINAKQDKRRFTADGGARKLIQKLSTGTTELYAKLCTWTTTQDGQKLMIKAAGSSGFNAYSIQQFELAVNVNTSNGHDDGSGQGYFSGQCYMHDMQNHRSNVRVYLIQPSSTVCEVWVKLPEYCTMVYEILVSADNEVDIEPEYQAAAPTTDAKYIYSPQALAKLNGWTASKVVVTDASGNLIANPNVSWTEVNMLKGVKSNLQTQLDDKQSQITNIKNNVSTNTLVGEIKWLAFSDSVSGWLLCDGRAVSRTDYSALFAAIGTTWGEGDGSTTFNLPNLIDKTVWGGSTVGAYKDAGLPNIEGELSNFVGTTSPTVSGALSIAGTGTTRFTQEASGDYATHRLRLDASSDIYGKSTTVQPPAAVLRPIIKY